MSRKERRRREKIARTEASKGSGNNPDQALQMAGPLFQSGQLDQAIKILQAARSQNPEHFDVNYGLAIIHATSGNLDAALPLFEKAVSIRPGDGEAQFNLGRALTDAGRPEDAIAAYRRSLEINPREEATLVNLGNALKDTSDFAGAADCFRRALTINPNNAMVHVNLGNALLGLEQLDDAVAGYREALGLNPNLALAHTSLGNALGKMGRLEEAVDSHHQAIAIKPDYAEGHNNLGIALKDLGRLEDAVASYQKAIAIIPGLSMAHSNLGLVLQDLGRVNDALTSFQRALAIKPDYAEAHCNYGLALHKLERLDESCDSYHKALVINPNYAEAYAYLGNALVALERLDEGVVSYHKAIEIKPEFAEAYSNLANALREQGNVDGAAKQIDLALSLKPEKNGWRIWKALFLPIIPSSNEDIQTRRDTLAKAVTEIMEQNLRVPDPASEVGFTNFYLAYHNQNNRSLLGDIAKMYIAVCPKLTFEAKHCRSEQREEKKVLRIGFLSANLRNHTVGKISHGIIQNFSRELFEVIIFRPLGKPDSMSEIIDQAADKVVPLHRNLEMDWKIIEDEELDILFHLDIGMDPYTYFLSFARLAPVQAVTIGHAESSGVPNIDYFMSSEMSEPENGSEHYTEHLIKLRSLPTYYYQPEAPVKPFTRDDYGLPEDVRLYVYPQSLFKIHPDFDPTIGELLRRDPQGRLVLIDLGKEGHLRKLLIERFKRSFPDVIEQVIFLPKLAYDKFLGLLLLADALLDNPYLSGINSGLEAFSMDVPIVAWPGAYCSGRYVTACYKQMGLSDLIATDSESYLKLALQLAQDADFKSRMQADIKANAHKLFETQDPVREMETFFIAAYDAWKTGAPITSASSA